MTGWLGAIEMWAEKHVRYEEVWTREVDGGCVAASAAAAGNCDDGRLKLGRGSLGRLDWRRWVRGRWRNWRV